MNAGAAVKNAILGGKLEETIYTWILVKKFFYQPTDPTFFPGSGKQFFKSSLINIVNIINIFNIIKVTLGTFFNFTYFNSYFQTKETCKRCQAIFLEQEIRWSLLGHFGKSSLRSNNLKSWSPYHWHLKIKGRWIS